MAFGLYAAATCSHDLYGPTRRRSNARSTPWKVISFLHPLCCVTRGLTRSDGNLILSRGCSGRSDATARKGNSRQIQRKATDFPTEAILRLTDVQHAHDYRCALLDSPSRPRCCSLKHLRTAARDAPFRLEAGGMHVSASGCSSSCPSCALPPCHPARMPRCRRGSDSQADHLHGSCSPDAEASGTWTAAIRS